MKPGRHSLLWITLSICVLGLILDCSAALAHFCWGYSSQPADNPLPWDASCDSLDGEHPANSTTGQTIRDEHRNWHCNNPVTATDAYGRAFLAFHRQFILDFNNWRLDNLPLAGRIETWDPYEDAAVPGERGTAPMGKEGQPQLASTWGFELSQRSGGRGQRDNGTGD